MNSESEDIKSTAKTGFFKRLLGRSETSKELPVDTTEDIPQNNTPPQLSTDSKGNATSASTKSRFSFGLARTSQAFGRGLANLLLGRKQIDDDLLEEIEMLLISADVGIEATRRIVADLTEKVARRALSNPESLHKELYRLLIQLLEPCEKTITIDVSQNPYVIMVVGVNGVGKTTTIGKMTHHFLQQGHRPLLAAGDTFRAAAVEQLKTWGERTQATVVAQQSGADSASVIFDAIQSAQARGCDLVIADTAGRLHNKSHLMEELSKVVRVMKKLSPNAPHEVLLVLDAGTGQNAVNQAKQFSEAVGVTGLVLTKLDGTAKGGILFALADKFKLPVRFIGLGEGIEDLQPFDAHAFVDGLMQHSKPTS